MIKIRRAESLGTYSWDSSDSSTNSGDGINQWGPSGSYEGADLMRELNTDYLGVSFQAELLKNAAPQKLTSDKIAELNQSIGMYAQYLQQLSSSFYIFQNYADYISGKENKPMDISYFSECDKIPKPDTCIYGISYDSKTDADNNIQYTYLLGEEKYTAQNLYNIYLKAIEMNSSLCIEINNDIAYITLGKELVSVTMAGFDSTKGYFFTISFKA